jgi:hypothetical protein
MKHLRRQFPLHNIAIIRASTMYLGTFANYIEFVNCNNVGIPEHSFDGNGWRQLTSLLQNIDTTNHFWCSSESPLTLVAFSKGSLFNNNAFK